MRILSFWVLGVAVFTSLSFHASQADCVPAYRQKIESLKAESESLIESCCFPMMKNQLKLKRAKLRDLRSVLETIDIANPTYPYRVLNLHSRLLELAADTKYSSANHLPHPFEYLQLEDLLRRGNTQDLFCKTELMDMNTLTAEIFIGEFKSKLNPEL